MRFSHMAGFVVTRLNHCERCKKMKDDTKGDLKVMQTYMYDVAYLYQASHEMGSGKQCRPRSDATERDV